MSPSVDPNANRYATKVVVADVLNSAGNDPERAQIAANRMCCGTLKRTRSFPKTLVQFVLSHLACLGSRHLDFCRRQFVTGLLRRLGRIASIWNSRGYKKQ